MKTLCLLLLFHIAVFAESRLHPPFHKEVAIQILAFRDDFPEQDYTLAFHLDGEQTSKSFTASYAKKVTYFGPKKLKNKKQRVLQSDVFFWSEDYGWFLYEIGERLGRPTVYIWSEEVGYLEIQ